MQKKIIIAIDSYKGCLTSADAGEAAAQGIYRACPDAHMEVIPVADGGEGLLETLVENTDGHLVSLCAHDPLMREINTCYGLSGDGKTAFIEMARISGLTLLRPDERNPMRTTSYGTGELIRNALRHGCRRVLIGLGGSATNDAGIGLLQALGYRFLDKENQSIGWGGKFLNQVERIDDTQVMHEVYEANFTSICDVRNPFTGKEGAAYVFAPQKGADQTMVEQLDRGLQHLARVIYDYNKIEISNLPGAGAAGGMGGGLHALLRATLQSGIDLVLDIAHFSERIKLADLVITGEGKADRQTLMGKVPMGVLTRARAQGIPTVLLAGRVNDREELLQAGFQRVQSINPPDTPLEIAMQPDYARHRLTESAEALMRGLFPSI